MNELTLLEVTRQAITTLLIVSAPLLGAALVVGLVISLIQAVTQVNEATLTFAPKIIAIFVAILVFGPWMGNRMLMFTVELFELLPQMAR
ncbi:MAG TPA: flagellar biosynthesis protein FliQ [Thermomicrobiales bacterium]|nr:flagellar biosynthesis protein FliQ [Thermomicrobiales bacterium]